MNKIQKCRYFNVNNGERYKFESIKFIQVSNNDPRGIALSGESGVWLPISIGNPGFDVNAIKPQPISYENVIEMNDDGTVSSVQKVTEYGPPVLMDVYSQPLLPGYVEITMQEYNAAMGPQI